MAPNARRRNNSGPPSTPNLSALTSKRLAGKRLRIKTVFRVPDVQPIISVRKASVRKLIAKFHEINQFFKENPIDRLKGALGLLESAYWGLTLEMHDSPRFSKEYYQKRLAQLKKEMKEVKALKIKRKNLRKLRERIGKQLDNLSKKEEEEAW